jgi:FMN phosphatase YigB (HAD superfamily)
LTGLLRPQLQEAVGGATELRVSQLKKRIFDETKMITKGILLDFGYMIGFPLIGVEWKYLYMDWNGIQSILKDVELKQRLRQNTSYAELEAFFNQEIYNVFIKHEKTDSIDPQSNSLLLNRLHLVFQRPITQKIVDRILDHIDTMKYINIDPESIKVIAELKQKGYLLAIVSNMMLPGRLLKAKLQETSALSLFDNITISSDVG